MFSLKGVHHSNWGHSCWLYSRKVSTNITVVYLKFHSILENTFEYFGWLATIVNSIEFIRLKGDYFNGILDKLFYFNNTKRKNPCGNL